MQWLALWWKPVPEITPLMRDRAKLRRSCSCLDWRVRRPRASDARFAAKLWVDYVKGRTRDPLMLSERCVIPRCHTGAVYTILSLVVQMRCKTWAFVHQLLHPGGAPPESTCSYLLPTWTSHFKFCDTVTARRVTVRLLWNTVSIGSDLQVGWGFLPKPVCRMHHFWILRPMWSSSAWEQISCIICGHDIMWNRAGTITGIINCDFINILPVVGSSRSHIVDHCQKYCFDRSCNTVSCAFTCTINITLSLLSSWYFYV